MMQRTISRDELKRKIKRGDDFVLVDTLGSDYYLHSHLPGAINLSVEYLACLLTQTGRVTSNLARREGCRCVVSEAQAAFFNAG